MTGRVMLPGKEIPASEIPDYSIDRRDSSEVYSKRFLARLATLNDFVLKSGETLEGGLFYWDQATDYHGRLPDQSLAAGRRNLWRASRFKRRVLEIGVNAGHAALLILSANNEIHYHGVDIASHRYTREAIDFLAAEFPGRVHFHPGDSRDALPRIAAHRPDLDFDLFHIDGGHTTEICQADVSNCVRLANHGFGKHLMLDDVHASWIFDVYAEFISRGYLTTETFFGDWEEESHNVLARIL